jgi:hypothetical protein
MNASRRIFLRASSLAGVATAITATFPRIAFGRQKHNGKPTSYQLPEEALTATLFALSRANFYGNLNTRFTFLTSGRSGIQMSLIAVDDLKPLYGKGRPVGKECFALTFQGPFGTPLRANSYTVQHSSLGSFDMFIVPTGEATPNGYTYEANFNRLYP